MKRTIAALALLALAACTPPAATNGAEAAVQAIYATAQQNLGRPVAPAQQIPMSDDLRALMDRAGAQSAARGEPFIEGDLALNCQDCTSVTDLVVGPQTGAEQEPPVAGHTWVQATFKLNGNEDRRMLWDMIETPAGWRVDNIISDGHDLRAEAQEYLDAPQEGDDTVPPPP